MERAWCGAGVVVAFGALVIAGAGGCGAAGRGVRVARAAAAQVERGSEAEGQPVGAFRDVSGLASAGEGLVLAVSDAKVGSRAARFALFQTADGSRAALEVDERLWATNDLESICAMPGTEGEYLAFESGTYDTARGGFAYRVKLGADAGGNARLSLLERIALPGELGMGGSTGGQHAGSAPDQIEGVVAWQVGARVMVMVGARMSGDLVLMELVGSEFEVRSRLSTSHLACERGRRIGELCLDARGGGGVVYAVQTDDAGDAGPFGSTVVRVGSITAAGEVQINTAGEAVATCDGLKVEGLCVVAGGAPDALVAGTDDEDFGLVVRWVKVGG